MSYLTLPMVEYFLDHFSDANFENVVIIGVQHILETTHSMFRSLYKLGMKPKNIFLLGKCYSTNLDVMNEMSEEGIQVSSNSILFDSHKSFDQFFEAEISNFIQIYKEKIKDKNPDLLIVLDDGGKFLKQFKHFYQNIDCPVVGIEQTSSGYESIKNEILSFPIINVAKDPLKLEIESPMIADAFYERLFKILNTINKKPKSFLIIGGGPIGSCIYKKLKHNYKKIDIFDTDRALSTLKSGNLNLYLGKYDCYIGCTGKTSISISDYEDLNNHTILASASSSDREFDAVFLRKKIAPYENCRKSLTVNGITILNSGFPVNFDGERENISPDLIQLTISLIAAAIIQALIDKDKLDKKIYPIKFKFSKILQEFLDSRPSLVPTGS